MGQGKMKIVRSCIKYAHCPATQERTRQWLGKMTVYLTYSPTFFPQVYVLESLADVHKTLFTRMLIKCCL